MNDKSKLELIGEIAQANNKNLELIEEINNLQFKIDKAIEYIEKYLEEHIIEDQPDEQSIFYDEKGRYIPNAKEQLLSILKGDK